MREGEGLPIVTVGFNRRYAPLTTKLKALLATQPSPVSMIMTVNAGMVADDHWINDPDTGGGRIVGECCHFVDLLRYVAGSPIDSVSTGSMGDLKSRDAVSVIIKFLDGSIGTLHYFTNGDRRFPKERLEVFCAGKILQLDNFRRLRSFGWSNFSGQQLLRQDKGQRRCAANFVDAITSGDDANLIPIEELLEVCQATFDIENQATGRT
jgi:predicted dehydrogenase